MEIYLLRHATAEAGHPDSERALTPDGKEKLRRVLKRSGARPSLIVSSPYRRALETAQIAAEVLAYEGQVARSDAITPDGEPESVWDEIRVHKDESAILFASH